MYNTRDELQSIHKHVHTDMMTQQAIKLNARGVQCKQARIFSINFNKKIFKRLFSTETVILKIKPLKM